MTSPSEAKVHAPATIGNCGPGFDTLSLALHGIGDQVTLRVADEDRIEVRGPGSEEIPTQWTHNVVGPALDALRLAFGTTDPLHVILNKPRPGCSGLGSSASSAGGAALAFARLYPDLTVQPVDLFEAAYQGEQVAGGGNPDDVAAVVQGGLSIVRWRGDGPQPARVQPPGDLHVAIAVPDVRLATTAMREALPDAWPRDAVVANLGNTAALVDACHRGDGRALAECLDDALALPARRAHVPFFDAMRAAGLTAGAHGVCLSGSGPAVAAFCTDPGTADRVAHEMALACDAEGHACEALVARPEMEVMHAAALH